MTELTHATFQDFVRANKFAVIHFWATWNGYDAKMKDVLESQIPTELGRQIAFGRFDTDLPEHHDLCRQHKILNLPFLAFYRDGSLVNSLTGIRTPGDVIVSLRNLVS